jgi:organic hydroperoxide reductase OsmC/OhrA
MTVRSGTAEWHGNVESGAGTVTVGDGVFEGAYSYDSRFGEGKGTNPEQLIAAAHASCFTMALSNVLSATGHPPESLRTVPGRPSTVPQASGSTPWRRVPLTPLSSLTRSPRPLAPPRSWRGSPSPMRSPM